MSVSNRLRVLVAAADPLARSGLVALLETMPDCSVVGLVSDGVTLADDIDIYRPEVILWDTGWNPGIDSLRDSLSSLPEDFPIVALIPEDNVLDLWTELASISLLTRDVDADRLWAALVAARVGLITLDLPLAAQIWPASGMTGENVALAEDLTPRETEVLELLAEGLSNRAIALRLDISEHTVKFHVTAIMSKLNAQSRTDAVVRATRLGIILL